MAYQEVDINAFGEDARHFNNSNMDIPVQRINGGDMNIPDERREGLENQRALDVFPPDPDDIMNDNAFDDDGDDFALDFDDDQGNNFVRRDDPQAAFPQMTNGQMLLNRLKWFIKDNWKKILIILSIIIVVAVVLISVLRKEGYVKIPFIDGTTGYIKHIKDKSENKASAIIEDANGNIIYSQTTQPVSRLNYDYEQMLPEESSHGAITIEAI